ncbi:family 78 glycoside hydrolase catalytic domain [Herbiconiux sp. KACC 21604]|uniref:family 78 glycoside hydrolase catalytic domain n=1 Tax=unclassified Herbiconiux TaxID=2618217 RepID=UPI0014909DF2|nr:family 78 glycoside hydrolase catalytic domain [Herbiconiux sp. SALV-R1]QJU55106.1 family 78 glycoside hydrolase catalytic domain [Herbiconiux sp. SALV-R1]WPO86254.1 family 78 glycoside hydrolase catalytic domain [Herbiconiux sp. KACC 21604]
MAARLTRLTHLTVEHTEEPLGVDVTPRFGWIVEAGETGANIRRWSIEVSAPGGESLWRRDDSDGGAGVDIEYEGPALRSLTRYDWSVSVETDRGTAEASSTFVTGLLDGDWRGARWISHPTPGGAAPLLRRDFTVQPTAAPSYLVVGAGGYARPEINGVPVPGFDLAPGFTDYEVTAQYCVVDITELLRPGRNAIGVELGRGFYGMAAHSTWEWETAPWHDEPCTRILIVTGDEVLVISDEGWRAVDGPTRYDDLYGGEDFDARADRPGFSDAGYDDAGWAPVTAARGPRGRSVNQRQQSIAVPQTFAPDRIEQTAAGRWLFTFPRVIAGRVRLQLDGAAGEVVTVRAAERLRADGRPDNDDPHGYYAGRFQECRVTLAGEPLRWTQRFGYQGFRYVEVEFEVEAEPDAAREPIVEAELLHTAVARTGGFRCSNALLTRLHDLTVDTVLNNLHGLPTDTPQYEKNGWTGDGMLGAELMLLNLDSHELLAKWADDIGASRHGAGAPEVIAPHGGWSMDWTPAPTWHASLLLVPWEIYRQRGDLRVLADTWPDASAYLDFELSRWPEGIADTTLGDWVSPDADPAGGNAPEDTRIAATAFLIASLDVAAKTAEVVGSGRDPEFWRGHAERMRRRFVEEFLDVEKGRVVGVGDLGDRQTHQVLALAFDLLPEQHRQPVADTLARLVGENGDHLNTGALGTKYLLPQLTRYGHAATALAVALQTDYPSWGLWVEAGATSLWEHWSPEARSHGHYFLGTLDDWLFGSVAGVAPAAPGWREIRIEPTVLGPGLGLTEAAAQVLTPLGRAAVSWRIVEADLVIDAEIPVGATATVHVADRVWEVASGRHRIRAPVPSELRPTAQSRPASSR